MQHLPDHRSNDIAIIGGGPAGLMAADVLASAGIRVSVYDRMPSMGRKLLMAGRGGLNLTHSEPLDAFLGRYGAGQGVVGKAVRDFTPDALREFAHALGQDTFIGSSGRVFPRAFKASPLLRAWLGRLDGLGVRFFPRHRLVGLSAQRELTLETPQGVLTLRPPAIVLAMGGASWPKLGSDGAFAPLLAPLGVGVSALRPANCGMRIKWSDIFLSAHEGAPVKRIALSFAGQVSRGEMIITRDGLEGGSIYALSAALRDAITRDGQAVLRVDLRPDMSEPELARRLSVPRGKQSLSSFLRKAGGLSPVGIGLLREGTAKPLDAGNAAALAKLIKALPLTITATAGLERAISTAGGVMAEAVDPHFMLHAVPGVFVAGEMLDWEAPTGGYLLQACFATGRAAGLGVLGWLNTTS